MPKTLPLGHQGFSIVEAMVVAGIMLTIMAGAATLITQMHKNQTRLEARLAMFDLEQLISHRLLSEVTCMEAFGHNVFNPGGSQQVSMNVGTAVSPLWVRLDEKLQSFGLEVKDFSLQNLQNLGSSMTPGHQLYRADLQGNFKSLRNEYLLEGDRRLASVDLEVDASNIIKSCSGQLELDPGFVEKLLEKVEIDTRVVRTTYMTVSGTPSGGTPLRSECPPDYVTSGCAVSCAGHTTDLDLSAGATHCRVDSNTYCSSGPVNVEVVCIKLKPKPSPTPP